MINKTLMLAAGLAALTMARSASAADITYTGSRSAGDITANYSFTTDGVVGSVRASDLVSYDIKLSSTTGASYELVPGSTVLMGTSSDLFEATPLTLSDPTSSANTVFYSVTHPSGFYDGFVESYPSGGFTLELGRDSDSSEGSLILANTVPPTVSAAPEPSAWALMLAGVGAMGLMLRRRRSAALTA